MPPRPHDSMEFTDTLVQVSERLQAAGNPALAAAILDANAEMKRAYLGGRGAEGVRSRVRTILSSIANDPGAEAMQAELQYAIGWIEKAGRIDREVSAKHHLNPRPSRDIRPR